MFSLPSLLGMTNPKFYDLREVVRIRTCTDTYDGSVHPMDGVVMDHVMHPQAGTIASVGRGFHSGSREYYTHPTGNVRLAATLLEMKALWRQLIKAGQSLAKEGVEVGTSAEVTFDLKESFEGHLFRRHNELQAHEVPAALIEHPNYLRIAEELAGHGIEMDKEKLNVYFGPTVFSWVKTR